MTTNLLLQDKPLLILPTLATTIGLNESIILQQLHYWLLRSKNTHRNRKWVYFTYDNLIKQFPFWSKNTIRRAISNLEIRKLIDSDHFNKMKMDQTKWYSINYDVLQSMEISSSHNELASNPIREVEEPILDTPFVQNEQMECPIGNNELPILSSAIPENSSESTSKISVKHDKEDGAQYVNPFQFYEENGFGLTGGYLSEKITAWCHDISDELVIEAMKVAIKHGVKKWSYVEAILRDWSEKNYRTVEEVYAAKRALKDKRSKKKTPKAARHELVPDWLLQPENTSPIHQDIPLPDGEKKRMEKWMEDYRKKNPLT